MKNLIVIIGPTAIGKTALSIKIANSFNSEILSCDSRQFYKELSIGTAVPSKQELSEAKHHFIHSRSIFDDYNVGDYENDALEVLDEIYKTSQNAILIGGSGLYVDAVVKGFDQFPKVPESFREELQLEFTEKGIGALQLELQKLDPEYFQEVDIENPQRIIRALEICRFTSKTFSSFRNKQDKKRDFNLIKIGLNTDREKLYQRINLRVDLMMEAGLLHEAKSVYEHKSLNSLQTVGYRELFKFFEGEWDLNFAIEEIKKNTRRFAKRQLTWFRKDEEIQWFEPTEVQNIISHIQSKLK